MFSVPPHLLRLSLLLGPLRPQCALWLPLLATSVITNLVFLFFLQNLVFVSEF